MLIVYVIAALCGLATPLIWIWGIWGFYRGITDDQDPTL